MYFDGFDRWSERRRTVGSRLGFGASGDTPRLVHKHVAHGGEGKARGVDVLFANKLGDYRSSARDSGDHSLKYIRPEERRRKYLVTC